MTQPILLSMLVILTLFPACLDEHSDLKSMQRQGAEKREILGYVDEIYNRSSAEGNSDIYIRGWACVKGSVSYLVKGIKYSDQGNDVVIKNRDVSNEIGESLSKDEDHANAKLCQTNDPKYSPRFLLRVRAEDLANAGFSNLNLLDYRNFNVSTMHAFTFEKIIPKTQKAVDTLPVNRRLSFDTTTFLASAKKTGAIENSIHIQLQNDIFSDNVQVEINNLPNDLEYQVVRAKDDALILSLTGKIVDAVPGTIDLTLHFADASFRSNNADAISGANANLTIRIPKPQGTNNTNNTSNPVADPDAPTDETGASTDETDGPANPPETPIAKPESPVDPPEKHVVGAKPVEPVHNQSPQEAKTIDLGTLKTASNNVGFLIDGTSYVSFSGTSVSQAGDVNGDGLDDIIVGSPRDDPDYTIGGRGKDVPSKVTETNEGSSFVIFGKKNYNEVNLIDIEKASNASGFIIKGDSAGDNSGTSVSGGGDINGDGLADLIVGAHNNDASGEISGACYVVFGKKDGLPVELAEVASGNNGFIIKGIKAGDRACNAVSRAGDVNGDGFDDIVVGVKSDDSVANNAGSAYVVFGKSDGGAVSLSSFEQNSYKGGFKISGTNAGDTLGNAVAGGGDVNGDGYADVIIGAHGYNLPSAQDAGIVFVVFGKANAENVDSNTLAKDNAGFAIEGANRADYSGGSVGHAGDVNGDGRDDIIIGAPFADPGEKGLAGSSYVVYGKADSKKVLLSGIAAGTGGGFVMHGVHSDDRSGSSVTGLGDFNGDGLSDLLVGAPLSDPNASKSGTSYVVFGKKDFNAVELSSIDASKGGFSIVGMHFGDRSGFTVSRAGDLNGDGFKDLIIGAPEARIVKGEAYVIFGGPFK